MRRGQMQKYLFGKAISDFADELSPLALLREHIGEGREVRLATADATVGLQHEVEVTRCLEITSRPGHCRRNLHGARCCYL